MSNVKMSPRSAEALREALRTHVGRPRRSHGRLLTAPWVLGAALMAIGGTAAAATLLGQPGYTVVEAVSPTVEESHVGSATVRLADAPANATSLTLRLECLSAGTFRFADGAQIQCVADDVGTPQGQVTYAVPVGFGSAAARIETNDDAAWHIEATFTNDRVTEWGVNARGETFGMSNVYGDPDLIFASGSTRSAHVIEGYVRASDLFERSAENGAAGSIPLLRSDGVTVIGDFQVVPPSR
jgi:hypothetical protein